jgi:hypothetical protein
MPEPIITEPGVYPDMPDEIYHSDPVPEGSLSSTGARNLLPPSCPAIFKWDADHPQHKTIFDFGHAAHQMILGYGPKLIVHDYDPDKVKSPKNTNAWKAQQAEVRANGDVLLLPDEYQQVKDMATALWNHPRARLLLDHDGGDPEQSIFWQDHRHGIWRRCRIDWLRHQRRGRLIIVDYKTAVCAETKAFSKAAVDHGYNQQDPWYCDGVIAAGLEDEPAFVFVVQEKRPPYLVNVIELDSVLTTIGRHLNDQAMQVYAQCKRTDVWPGYSDGIELATAPAWYRKQYEDVIAGKDHLPA